MKNTISMVALSILALCSCTNSSLTPDKGTTQDSRGFQKVEGWPESIKSRRVGKAFSESIVQIQHDSAGNIWALREEFLEPKSDRERVLEKYDAQGNLLLSIPNAVSAFINAFTVHPNGELTVAETRKRDATQSIAQRNIWLRKLSPEGSLIYETPLRDVGTEKEKIDYEFDYQERPCKFLGTKKSDTPFDQGNIVPSWTKDSHGELLALGEETLFLVWSHGLKLYKLGKDLSIIWGQQAFPCCGQMQTSHSWREKIAVDEKGNIFVITSVNEEDIFAWEKHFERNVALESNKSSLFVAHFDSNGHFQNARVFGRDNFLSPVGMAASKGILTIGATTRVEGKFNEPNHTMERDLVFLRANVENGEVLDYKEIDLKRDDSPRDFKMDSQGNGYFAGKNDYVQVDTNSQVEFGQSFILKVDGRGNTLNCVEFRSDRNSGLNTLSIGKSGEIVFGGYFNGPMTHTGDNDRNLTFQWGLLGVLQP